ncbi:MAG: DNA mismatch repair protein MutS [Planctomycetaceae bacterium]|jgi:DNA mismatch repair protein MutS|nr:DNA mismatch repair protein MutS [Planctomycetaceae bacterium]
MEEKSIIVKTTPMMKQYNDAKLVCGDAVLFFRMGDFYEMFQDDALTAAPILGLALTSRDKGPNAMPMAGFPHHQLDMYVGRLIRAGHRVAVCDQMEDPKLVTKGLVKREITRIISPGTVTEEELLDPRESNFLAAWVPSSGQENSNKIDNSYNNGGGNDSDDKKNLCGLAWVEVSTGQFYAATLPQYQLVDQLARLSPSELIIPEGYKHLFGELVQAEKVMRTTRPEWAFGTATALQNLQRHFKTLTLEGFGFSSGNEDLPGLRAAGAILDYLNETQKQSLAQLDSLHPYRTGRQLEIDEASRRSLEISRTIRDGNREASLLGVLDRCVTSMGARLLADWVNQPLTVISEIEARQNAIEELFSRDRVTLTIREQLKKVYDLERLITRIVQGRGTPRDLVNVGKTLSIIPSFIGSMKDLTSPLLVSLRDSVDPCTELRETLNAAMAEDCALNPREGNFIRSGFNAELDEMRRLRQGGKEWIASYQAQETERTGIPRLKVSYNRVFGYYIEISNVNSDKIPPTYIRKQTIKGAERYITPELKEYEEKVLTADERSCAIEFSIFEDLIKQTLALRGVMSKTAAAFSFLDVLTNLAKIASERDYCKPKMVSEPVLHIVDGRHPVLDVIETGRAFVPNDVNCDACGVNTVDDTLIPSDETSNNEVVTKSDDVGGSNCCAIQLITGPNMAGKSTFIRQIALLSLMGQIGSFIPAREATLGIADRIFARVGASDELARGQSTFMVEMTETARILNTATSRSLVILDEIGRGTSTYDGVSLAWAVVEYLHDAIGCRTFFATHYHELTDLEESMSNIGNLNVAVRDNDDDIAFLYKIVKGAADKSYGIHVARLAGVPKCIIQRANEILDELESTHNEHPQHNVTSGRVVETKRVGNIQFSLFGPNDHPVVEELRTLNVEKLKANEMKELLEKWKRML